MNTALSAPNDAPRNWCAGHWDRLGVAGVTRWLVLPEERVPANQMASSMRRLRTGRLGRFRRVI